MKVEVVVARLYSVLVVTAVCCIPQVTSAQTGGQIKKSPDPAAVAAVKLRTPQDATAYVDSTMKEAAALPTPRLANGHPDLTGYWGAVIGMFGYEDKSFITPDGQSLRPLFAGGGEARATKAYVDGKANYDKNSAHRPDYKPEFRQKVKDNFMKSEILDPSFTCQAEGVPRIGAPNEIFASADAVVLLYENPYDTFNHYTYRVVPTDGQPHNPDADLMALGDSVGHWDGDTLVIDVTNISPKTWMDNRGSFHDENLHVIERITRKGNTINYSVTMDDSTLLEKPYSPNPVNWILKSGHHSHEDYPCVERDQGHIVYDNESQK
jgi:hypothetical protein